MGNESNSSVYMNWKFKLCFVNKLIGMQYIECNLEVYVFNGIYWGFQISIYTYSEIIEEMKGVLAELLQNFFW